MVYLDLHNYILNYHVVQFWRGRCRGSEICHPNYYARRAATSGDDTFPASAALEASRRGQCVTWCTLQNNANGKLGNSAEKKMEEIELKYKIYLV